jgi:hypothetical protein
MPERPKGNIKEDWCGWDSGRWWDLTGFARKRVFRSARFELRLTFSWFDATFGRANHCCINGKSRLIPRKTWVTCERFWLYSILGHIVTWVAWRSCYSLFGSSINIETSRQT